MIKTLLHVILLFTILLLGCKTSNYPTNSGPQIINSNTEIALKENKMLQAGIDFFAEGNEPSTWKMEMNIDDTVRFVAADGLSLVFGYNQLSLEEKEGIKYFYKKNKNGDIKITISDNACSISKNENSYKKEVRFAFNSITYTGCGKYLSNANLSNKWMLYKVGNTFIEIKEYNPLPTITINLDKNTISGNDGCNNINGKIEVQGDRIFFAPISATKKYCSSKNLGNLIQEKISNHLVNYYFKDGNLYLYLIDDSLLVFKKS